MPRRARVVAIGLPHHITQRGNFQQVIFESDTDRKKYLTWIKEYSDKYRVYILCYCLMPNHVHFITIPEKGDSLAKTFNTAHMRYAQYMNKKMKRSGHLWQGRFYSCILSESHLMMAARYIERNPVRAKLVTKPWHWKWSSAQTHINKDKGRTFVLSRNLLALIDMMPTEWEKYIDTIEDKKEINDIKKHTLVGRPLGNTEFIKELEGKTDKRFPIIQRGRPRKAR